jgi:peptidoglycan hydrolase-like protein with peptidoglycan-binding domain
VCVAFTIEPGVKNDSDVKNIQRWLISQNYNKVEATGYYGAYTQRAIKHFQEEYAADILVPAGLTKATGTWGEFTAKKASSMGLCDYDEVDNVELVTLPTAATVVTAGIQASTTETSSPNNDVSTAAVLEDIYPGVCLPRTIEPDAAGEKGNANDVKIMQRFLVGQGYTLVEVTGYYGPTTKRAIEFFQKRYKTDILEPAGLTKPTGTWGIRTAIKASEVGLCNYK